MEFLIKILEKQKQVSINLNFGKTTFFFAEKETFFFEMTKENLDD
jgi:hypothetical protein